MAGRLWRPLVSRKCPHGHSASIVTFSVDISPSFAHPHTEYTAPSFPGEYRPFSMSGRRHWASARPFGVEYVKTNKGRVLDWSLGLAENRSQQKMERQRADSTDTSCALSIHVASFLGTHRPHTMFPCRTCVGQTNRRDKEREGES